MTETENERTIEPTRVVQGDCIDVMRQMPAKSVNFVLTDPPYLCRYADRGGRTIHNDNNKGDWLAPAFAQMHRLLAENSFCVSFYGWHRVDAFVSAWRNAGFRILEHLVFVKRYDSSTGFVSRRHEQAYLLAKGHPTPGTFLLPDVMDWHYTQNRLHPTQKSVEVLRPIVQAFSRPHDRVLDPFCGSGSTLIAAMREGRTGIGIELDRKYADVASNRLAAFVGAAAA
jgi:site-specific DNA-methyltransferase (adenine-specific)